MLAILAFAAALTAPVQTRTFDEAVRCHTYLLVGVTHAQESAEDRESRGQAESAARWQATADEFEEAGVLSQELLFRLAEARGQTFDQALDQVVALAEPMIDGLRNGADREAA
jgi:hypothetical protein